MNSESIYVINSTPEIRKKYYQMYPLSKYIHKKEKEGIRLLPEISNLLCDIFCSLFMANPSVKDYDNIDKRCIINMIVMQGMLDSSFYKSIRHNTSFSAVKSIWTTEIFADKLLVSLSLGRGGKKINIFKNKYIPETEGIVPVQEENKKKKFFFNWFPSLNYSEEKKDKDFKKDTGILQKLIGKIAIKISRDISFDKKIISDIVDICQGWEVRNYPLERLNYQDKIKLADQMKKSSRLQELAKIIGHMRVLAIHSRYEKIRELSYEIYDVVLGDDLSKIHPIEIAYLSNPSFKYDFYQRMAQKKLIQYELKNNETPGKGSIIVCIDTSGSMSGKNEIMSKAVTLGLLEIARADKRNFIAIIFGQKGKVKTFIFGKEDVEIILPLELDKKVKFLEGLFDFTVSFIGGGTDFETPLKTAISFRKKINYQDADLLFITDDLCGMSEEFMQYFNSIKKTKNMRTYGILIGPKYQEPGTMKKFCDEILNYHVLTDDMAKSIFEKVS